MTTTLESIDPSLSVLGEFSKLTGGTSRAIQSMREKAIFSDGVIPAKFKALAAALWAISARCEPCIKFYVREAARLGASKEELGEFLAVAPTMGGCVGEMWAVKALHAYLNDSVEPTSDPACACST